MAKVTITIEDKLDGKVSVVVNPSLEVLIKKQVSGNGTTSAEGYAFYAAKAIRDESKRREPIKIFVPRLVKP